MLTQQLSALIVEVTDQQSALLETIEAVLARYRDWKQARQDIQAQIAYDFQLSSLPTQDQAGDALHHYSVFVIALRLVADQLEEEIEETTDQYYEWLCD